MSQIYRLMYSSLAHHPRGGSKDLDILQSAISMNSKQDITGILLHTETGYVQVLEVGRKWLRRFIRRSRKTHATTR